MFCLIDDCLLFFEALINQTRQQTKYCLGLASKKGSGNNNHYNTGLDEDETIDKMRKEIESSQENALSLCTEKVLLARQAYDLVSSMIYCLSQVHYHHVYLLRLQIDSHLKRLDEDLNNFSEDLKQGM